MMVGANIEAQSPQRFAVGRALERVQGSHRLMLEQYRRQARSEAAAVPRQVTQLQPSRTPPRRQPQQASFNDEAVLRQRIVIPLDRLLASGAPRPLSAEELAQRKRQAIDSRVRPPHPTAVATPPTTESDDPFRDDPSRTEAAEAAATMQPTLESSGEVQPVAEEVAETEATSESAEETPEAEATPEAETMPEDGDNPFDS
jgi:hypothetical protein